MYHLIYSTSLLQNLSSHLRFRHTPSLRHSEQPRIATQSFRTFTLSHFPLPFALWCALCLGSSKAEISSFHRVGRHPFVTSTLSDTFRLASALSNLFTHFRYFAHLRIFHLFFYRVRVWPFFVHSWSLLYLLHPTTPVSLLGLGNP